MAESPKSLIPQDDYNPDGSYYFMTGLSHFCHDEEPATKQSQL